MSRLALALALAAVLAPAGARARGPSTKEERRRAVEVTRRLEKEPLAHHAMEDRQWLLQWIVEIPDVNVTGCAGPLDTLLKDEDRPYGQLLFVQSVFGMAAFLVEHPAKAKDWAAVQTAGIQSVLRTYRSLLRADSGARWKELDRLAAAEKQGKLRALVEKEMADCGKGGGGDEEMGPAPREAI